jgi:hypothetical protein
VNVLTAHNDIARTGQNLNETVLTPANVNPTEFGKLYSQHVTGRVYAQPLYVSQLAIPGKGVHNVVYVATTSDLIYAFDADTNGGINAHPLWQTSLLTNAPPTGTYNYNFGVSGTPVIDLSTNTMFVASSERFVASSGSQAPTYIARLHALDITTGAEKLGGPIQIQASIPGTGSGSTGGVLTFDPQIQRQRAGLLLLNGVLYVGFGSDGDDGDWHGWIFSFAETTLQQLDAFCTTPNGAGGGVWMGGAGLAAEVNNPAKPYGRMFVATGNGTFAASYPYTGTMSYGMSMLNLDLSGGRIAVEDEFTPYDQAILDAQDADLGSGGPILLPTQTLASGATLNPLVQIGKSGMIYILDRDNNTDGSNNPTAEFSPAGLGAFNAAGDKVEQEVQTPETAGNNWGAGVWGSEAYWNNNIYSGGTNPTAGSNIYFGTYAGTGNSLTAYSFINGVLSSMPTSQSVEQFIFPGPTPSIFANGTTNGIVWVTNNSAVLTQGPEALLAYDATNLANTLYSSNTNPSRDAPGGAVEFMLPTITNGKVYVGADGQINVYGLLGITPTTPAPAISPSSGPFTGIQTVTISDAVPGVVWFGGISLPILNPSNTSIQVVVPTGAATGTFDVHSNGVGTYTSTFTMTAVSVPQITSVSTSYAADYAKVVLTGTNFGATQGASTVTFNGAAAGAATVWSNTGITVSVPYRATTGNLLVTVSGQSSNGVPFTVEPTASITGISPSSGPPGTLATISGQNLLDGGGNGVVWFGGKSLPILNPSSTSLQVAVPAGAATGTFDVQCNGIGNYTPIFTVN